MLTVATWMDEWMDEFSKWVPTWMDGWMDGFSKWVLTPKTQEEGKIKENKRKEKEEIKKKENSTLQNTCSRKEKTLIHESLIREIGPGLYKEPWQGPLFFKILIIVKKKIG